MDLVTVTCNKDLKHMLLQAKSVGLFLKNESRHWILINEPQPSLHTYDWYEILSPYYKDHELKVVYLDPVLWQFSSIGWVIQQIQKLKAVDLVNDDYLLLDSKNFLAFPVDLSEWTHGGSGGLISETTNNEVWKYWDDVNTKYSQWLNVPKLETYYAVETPFVIQKEIARLAISVDNFEKKFIEIYNGGSNASEFIYYSYFLRDAGHEFKNNRRHFCLWDRFTLDRWFAHEEYPLMEISGIHRDWILKASPCDKQHLIQWLSTFGLIDERTITLFD